MLEPFNGDLWGFLENGVDRENGMSDLEATAAVITLTGGIPVVEVLVLDMQTLYLSMRME